MAHILRKYTSNRGSALFMVISTMTALIISCMAMYFTMVSARASQYAVFSQMQATQTAQSVLEIARGSLNPYNSLNPDFKDKLLALEEGESITTDANGFMALDPNIETGATPAEIGAYSVTITCISKTGTVDDGDLEMEFDYLVMSSFNGSRDAIHFVQKYSQRIERDPSAGDDGSGGDAELFAATGYIPNDAYIAGGYYVTNVFYDTQYTYMSTYSDSGENFIGQDLYTGGSLMLGEGAKTIVHGRGDSMTEDEQNKIGPVTWAIRGNFYPFFNADFAMRGGSQILVGGNYNYSAGEPTFQVKNDGYDGDVPCGDHISIYVNGDFNYSGSYIKSNVWVFVNGKVTGVGENAQTNTRIYVSSRADTSELNTNTPIYDWPDSGTFDDGLTYNEAINLLKQKTDTIAYYKWDLSKNTETADTQHVDVRTNSTNSDWTDDKGNTYEAGARNFIFAYPGSQSEDFVTDGSETGVVGKSFIIDSIWTHGDGNNPQTIIIDTGDDPTNIMTIKLSDVTGHGEFSWFVDREEHVISWWPYEATLGDPETCLGRINGNNQRLVMLRGRGTVLLDVPEGVIYQDSGYGMVGHVGWWLIEGGEISEENGHLKFSGVDPQGKPSATIVPYIHRTCGGVNANETDPDVIADGDGCVYTYSESDIDCIECSNKLTKVTCDIHNDVNKFCMTCHPEKISRSDWCVNHVDNKNFKDFYETLSGNEKAWVTGNDGEIVYPTTNIMLVSCDEAAEMRFSHTTDDEEIICNSFFGFVYAPYMSFLAGKGSQAGGMIKLCGGMTVGDYDIQATHVYVGCYPDHMPNELAAMGGGEMPGTALKGVTKTWKIDLGGYR